MNHFAIVTSREKVYQSLALIDSIRQSGDDSPIHILADCQEVAHILEYRIKRHHLVLIYLLEKTIRAEVLDLFYQRARREFFWTLKPVFMRGILQKIEHLDSLTYIDSDIVTYAHLTDYLAHFNYAVFITEEEQNNPSATEEELEQNIKHTGRFNSGLLSFKKCDIGEVSLSFWEKKCIESCEINSTTFGDQKYLDLFPKMFHHIYVDPGYTINVGKWNLRGKDVKCVDGKYKINNQNLIAYHFSGFRICSKKDFVWVDDPNIFAHDRFQKDATVRKMYEDYQSALMEHIIAIEKTFPDFNGYASDDGSLIPQRHKLTLLDKIKKKWKSTSISA